MESKSEQKSATEPTETTHSTVRTISILTIDFFLLGYARESHFMANLYFRTPFMEDGVERIVEQVVNPKIMSVIQPEVCISVILYQLENRFNAIYRLLAFQMHLEIMILILGRKPDL